MATPRKTGVATCYQCRDRCRDETYSLVRKDLGNAQESSKIFCSRECMAEHFEEEFYLDKLSDSISKEHNLLYKQVCPACKTRLHKLL